MKSAILQRLETDDLGTFGTFTIEGTDKVWMTAELPWRHNYANISCIPAGTYDCIWNMSNRFKRMMYLVKDVPERAGVRFHAANFAGDEAMGHKADLNGCIALGKEIAPMAGQKALWQSRDAMAEFESHMAGETFKLTVLDVNKQEGVSV